MTDSSFDQILGRYDELWTICSGPSGRVAAALHKATGRRVALKFFDYDLPSDPAVARRFRAQARLWQEVDSSQVVHLYEYIEAGSASMAVLELVDGPSLGRLGEREGRIPPVAALAVLDDILTGLAAAHDLGLLHGNLKPENVLLDRDGHAKITDFGIPRSPPRPSGNAPYLAPEQRHASPAGTSADLYAAAAVFFRCLTGAEPHAGGQAAQAEAAAVIAQAPGPLRSLIQHGLAESPAERPRSASEFRAELGAAATSRYGAAWKNDGTGILRTVVRKLPAAGPVPGSSPASAVKRRLSVAALAAAAFAVSLLVVTTLLTPHGHSSARPGPSGPAHAPGPSGRAHAEPASAVAAPAEFYGVSCTALTACTAVGSTGYHTAVAAPETLAEGWNGTNWTIQPTPDPPGTNAAALHPPGTIAAALQGVSCTSPSACIAVGGSLAERWNGTNWTIQPTPDPPGGAELEGVSCTSPSACIAVGGSDYARGRASPSAERWNGTNWAIQPTPAPAGRTGSEFYGVSCTSPSACIAVGGSPYGGPPLAERWDGTNWAIQPTPDPPGLISSTFYGVSCTSPTACTAVGNTNEEPMAERWNGASWTIQHVPVLSAIATGFGGVSCTSPTECTGVGPDDIFPDGMAAGRWNGVQWAATPALQPAGEVYATLYGVSCTSPTACTAVGQSNNNSPADVPLAERWNGTSWTIQHPPAPASTALPVLYNLGGGLGSVWNNPEVRPAIFYIFADGSGAVIGMRWSRWNYTTAITSSATYYDRSGPCCTDSDQHHYKVTVTLSGVREYGGPEPGPYFGRMTITGPGFRPLTYTYKTFVSGGAVSGAWT